MKRAPRPRVISILDLWRDLPLIDPAMTGKHEDPWEFLERDEAALVPLYNSLMDGPRRGEPLHMKDAGHEEQQRFYRAVIDLPWLAPKVRYAVMKELRLSLREQNIRIERAWTVAFRYQIADVKQRMRRNGERPPGGVHEAALAEVAKRNKMAVDALKQRLARLRRYERATKTG
jgi:hypothetical protein